MIDNFALAITHGLMALAVWVLLTRVDLNHEPSPHDRDGKGRRRGEPDFEEKAAPGKPIARKRGKTDA